jgi:hypothetical protein
VEVTVPVLFVLLTMAYMNGSWEVRSHEFNSKESCAAAREFIVKNAQGNKALVISDCMSK